jgi:ketosteroid isomerase-like protein
VAERAPEPSDDRAEVQDVVRRFYAAVESGDLDEMTALWQPGSQTLCVHPGFGPVRGTAKVLRSWALVMAQASYVQYVLTDELVELQGDTALAGVTENVLSAGRGTPVESFDGGRVVATFVLRRSGDGRWLILARHASPLADTWRTLEDM